MGHHVYKKIWTPYVGEQLDCQHEKGNTHDKHAMAIKKEAIIVGHVPKSTSQISALWAIFGHFWPL